MDKQAGARLVQLMWSHKALYFWRPNTDHGIGPTAKKVSRRLKAVDVLQQKSEELSGSYHVGRLTPLSRQQPRK